MDIKVDEIVKQVLAEIGTVAGREKAFVKEPVRTVCEQGKKAVLVQTETYKIKTFDIPNPGEKEILVRMEGCMISGADIAEFLKERKPGASGATGREGTGVVVKTGSDSLKDARGNILHVGDKVAVVRRAGISGSYYCNTRPDSETNGWFSNYVVLQAGTMVYQVNGLDMESRLLIETAAAVNNAVKRVMRPGKLNSASTAVVMGCTLEGLMAMAVLKCNGIKNITAIGSGGRKNIAASFGAGEFIGSCDGRSIHEMKEMLMKCGGSLADVVFNCTASSVGKSAAKRLLKNSGSICEVTNVLNGGRDSSGYYGESLPPGGRFYTMKDYEEALDFLFRAAKEEIPMYRLISHRYKLEEINEAHWAFIRGEGLGIAVFNR